MPSPFLLPSFCLYSAVSPTAERAPVRGTGAACFFYARRIMAELLDLFRLQHPIWEMVLRGTVIYIGLLLVFRFLLHRDVGSMSVADLLFVVLVADASSNAMQGDYRGIGDGLVLIGTMIAWNYALDWLAFRSAAVARLLEGPPEVLVRHGRLNRRAMKRELITEDELLGKLRQQGVEHLADVRIAQLESDGNLSVFRRNGQSRDHVPPSKHPPAAR
jgi:uncharacterized membrane protein YcaP (DUF421 family)